MKVALMGASGTGKTTLAKWVSENFDLPFTENSAGLIIQKKSKEYLKSKHGYNGDWGQQRVINESTLNPQFGIDFQRSILESRTALISSIEKGVFDRSPMDPYVFFLNQCVHNQDQRTSAEFLSNCMENTLLKSTGITHLIYVPLLNPNKTIENNQSRCHNYYFQKKVDTLFEMALDDLRKYSSDREHVSPGYTIENYNPIKILRVGIWNWEQRVKHVQNFLNG